VIGEMKERPFLNEKGEEEMRMSVDIGMTVDERVTDGYYCSKTVRLIKKLIEEPELLELPLGEKVEY
jgi:pyruvate/2-oxoglutarate dehydrogenase complex dihydrolipoamide acyltransferase (E2) component